MWQGQDSILGLIGKVLHLRLDSITHEPLPRRWVDLIQHLEEQERGDRERQLERKTKKVA